MAFAGSVCDLIFIDSNQVDWAVLGSIALADSGGCFRHSGDRRNFIDLAADSFNQDHGSVWVIYDIFNYNDPTSGS